MHKMLLERQEKISHLKDECVRWEKKALDALTEDNAWALQEAFQERGADLQQKVVGYSRFGRYGRVSLSQYPGIVHRPPGDSLLHLAVRNKRMATAAKLLSLGAAATAENDLGETVIDAVQSKPEMCNLFQGLVVHLPSGHNLVFEQKAFPAMKEQLQKDSIERQMALLHERNERQVALNTNHLRARDHAEAKLLRTQKLLRRAEVQRGDQSELRADMQAERDRADGRRQNLERTVDDLKEENARLREMEARWLAAERRCDEQARLRAAAETALAAEQETTAALRVELHAAQLTAAATEESLKDAVAAGLSASMACMKQAQVAEGLIEVGYGGGEAADMAAQVAELRAAQQGVFHAEKLLHERQRSALLGADGSSDSGAATAPAAAAGEGERRSLLEETVRADGDSAVAAQGDDAEGSASWLLRASSDSRGGSGTPQLVR